MPTRAGDQIISDGYGTPPGASHIPDANGGGYRVTTYGEKVTSENISPASVDIRQQRGFRN